MQALADALATTSFQRSLLEAVLVGMLSGVVGVHVMLRRLPFFVVAMSHATFPGVVLASILGVSLFLGGATFGLVVVALLVLLGRVRSVDDTSAVGVLLAGAFAVGVLLQSARTGGSTELSSFLVGSLATVSSADLRTTVIAGSAVVIVLAALHKELVLTAFDPEGARANGYPVGAVDASALAAVTLALVVTVPAVGTLLAVALLTVPAITARLWTDRIGRAMALAAGAGATAGLAGLFLSAAADIAAGASVVLVAAAQLLVTFVLTAPALRRGQRQSRQVPSRSIV
jgi:ABC-type Mn2+/Zn2+ transport system permease subunit